MEIQPSVGHFGFRLKYLAIKLCADIRGTQKMNPNDFLDPVTFHIAPPSAQMFQLLGEISQHLPDGLAPKFVWSFMVLRG